MISHPNEAVFPVPAGQRTRHRIDLHCEPFRQNLSFRRSVPGHRDEIVKGIKEQKLDALLVLGVLVLKLGKR